MGRGRKAKPAALSLLDGNASKRPINDDAPKPALADNPDPFDWLSEAAQEIWRRLVPEMQTLGILTKVDLDTFGGYCAACATFQECEKYIADEGMTYESESEKFGLQIKTRPEVRIRAEALKIVRSFASEFGLTPSSRTRIKIEKPDPQGELGLHEATRRPRRRA